MWTVKEASKDTDSGVTIKAEELFDGGNYGRTIEVYIPPVMIDALCDMLDLPFPNPTAGTLDTRAR